MTVNSQTGFETSEIGWADSSGATGGGVSVVFKKVPMYQRHVKNIIKGGRNLPDIAFDASPFTGESWYVEGRWNGRSAARRSPRRSSAPR